MSLPTQAPEASPVIVERIDSVAWVTLNRPEARNAIDDPLADVLVATLDDLADDPDVVCVVVTGAGSAFCAGGDLRMLQERRQSLDGEGLVGGDAVARLRLARRRVEASRLLHEMPKPTVALINGPAVGAGLSVALACDFRIAADDARLIVRFQRLGLSGDYGISFFLTRLLGPSVARRLCFLRDEVTAAEALELGLVDRVCPPGELHPTGREFVAALSRGAPLAQALTKENLLAAETGSLTEILERELVNTRLTSMTHDAREGAAALAEGRPPRFIGR